MIAFVILHYRAADMTRKCVERIKALEGDKKIVIVDNASPNGTGQKLLDEYTEDSEIKVILNPENSGFAKGNNMGVRWVQENVPADIADIRLMCWDRILSQCFPVFTRIRRAFTDIHWNP